MLMCSYLRKLFCIYPMLFKISVLITLIYYFIYLNKINQNSKSMIIREKLQIVILLHTPCLNLVKIAAFKLLCLFYLVLVSNFVSQTLIGQSYCGGLQHCRIYFTHGVVDIFLSHFITTISRVFD